MFFKKKMESENNPSEQFESNYEEIETTINPEPQELTEEENMLLWESYGDHITLFDWLEIKMEIAVLQLDILEASSGNLPPVVSFYEKQDQDGNFFNEIECKIYNPENLEQFYSYQDSIEKRIKGYLSVLSKQFDNPAISEIPITFELINKS